MSEYDDRPYIVIERHGGGVGAFLLGALAGAGAALLFAPRSGRETRDELRTGVLRLKERAEDTVRTVQDNVSDTITNVRAEVGNRVEAARDAFEAGRSAARETRADLERRISETRAGVRAGIEAARRSREDEEAEGDDSGDVG